MKAKKNEGNDKELRHDEGENGRGEKREQGKKYKGEGGNKRRRVRERGEGGESEGNDKELRYD